MILKPEQEKKVIRKLLLALNVSEDEANATAEVLTEGDLRGLASHGLLRLPYILRALRRGTIVSNASVKVVRETPATALVDGGHGLGHYVATCAMRLAIEKAKKQGVAAVGVFNSNHFGIAGYYAELAMREGLIGMVTTTTDALVHPWGGVEPFLGTNALAVGFPTEPPILLDMAMSVAARGKLVNAMKKGQKIPEGWAIDSEGNPTTDPKEGLKGALSPFGGPKGYGLAFVLELLAGPLVSAGVGKEVDGTLEPVRGFCTKGDFMIAMDPTAFVSLEEFKTKVREYVMQIKSSKRAPGVTEIMVPGEPEQKTREKRIREGIPIVDEVWKELEQLAKEIGVDIQT
ncbi:MAG: sulfolactate dehydrogenase [Hadesarchaea archaeon]|nr:MAG: sulfolactate dehydrogenase [Hadesarchaea archaeon]HDI12975.1 Ldh family oxidoreductase [Hadesarchaea archaeon]